MADDNAWGSDTDASMPEPVDDADTLIDFGTHVFTPNGIRINARRAVIEELRASRYQPIDGGD